MNRLLVILGAALFLAACDNEDCGEKLVAVGVEEVCNTTIFATGQTLAIDVRTESIDDCAAPVCSVERKGGDLFVTVERDLCEAAAGRNEACAIREIETCLLPAMDDGSYALRVNGVPSGYVTVSSTAADTSCRLH